MGGKLNRPEVDKHHIAMGLADISAKLLQRLEEKGHGAYASKHEMLGILEEEMLEVTEGVRDDSYMGLANLRKEFLDIGVAGLFAYISMPYIYECLSE